MEEITQEQWDELQEAISLVVEATEKFVDAIIELWDQVAERLRPYLDYFHRLSVLEKLREYMPFTPAYWIAMKLPIQIVRLI